MVRALDPKNQTNDEWLADYDHGADRTNCNVTSFTQKQSNRLTGCFRYSGHRTARLGRVVLIFKKERTHKVASLWFNVNLKGRKANYPAGNHGQFNPPTLGKFRRWWINTTDKPPRRWSRIHERLHALKAFTFIGVAERRYSAKNEAYWHLVELTKQK